MKISLLTLLLVVLMGGGSAHAGEAVQEDWSGGPGPAGPVSDWGSRFLSASQVSWCSLPGQVALASTPLATPAESQIDGDFDGACSLPHRRSGWRR